MYYERSPVPEPEPETPPRMERSLTTMPQPCFGKIDINAHNF